MGKVCIEVGKELGKAAGGVAWCVWACGRAVVAGRRLPLCLSAFKEASVCCP